MQEPARSHLGGRRTAELDGLDTELPQSHRPLHAMLWGKEEDRFTEFLASVLQVAGLERAFLENFCRLGRLPSAGVVEVKTQYAVEEGRPDLLIELSGPTRAVTVLVEVKVDSWLHPKQLPPYKRWLDDYCRKQGREGRLLVLGPSRNEKGLQTTAALQVGGRSVSTVSWEEVAYFLARSAAGRLSASTKTYLVDFADLVRSRMGGSAVPTRRNEAQALTRSAAKGLKNAAAHLRPLAEILEDRGYRITASVASGYDGFNLRSRKRWW